MRIIKHKQNIPTDDYVSSSTIYNKYFSSMNTGFFDIETTGLSSERCSLILAGIVEYDNEGYLISTQYFAETLDDEPELLNHILAHLRRLDVIVTYNGNNFDMPFFSQRCQKYNIDAYGLPYNIDIYLLVRHYSPIRKFLPNLKQKSLESYMGLWETRCDEISGAESVELYWEYIRTHDQRLMEVILLHNNDDIWQMTRLMNICHKCDLHSFFYTRGFPVKTGSGSNIIISGYNLSNGLKISGSQRFEPVTKFYPNLFNNGTTVELNCSNRTCNINIPVTKSGTLQLVDIQTMGLLTDDLRQLPSVIEGYLVITQKSHINKRGLNLLTMALMDSI